MPTIDSASTAPPGSFADLIVSGGDERLVLDSSGRNRYWVDPLQTSRVLNRGSCTCSPLTAEAATAARRLLRRIESRQISVDEARNEQRRSVTQLYDPEGDHDLDVIFAPSGSDLCYLPLLFSSILYPGQTIRNLVVCCEELGSGSLLAHQGRFFSQQTQAARSLEIGRPVRPDLKIIYTPFSARGDYGEILDHSDDIGDLIRRSPESEVMIVNLVVGSKSGIENSLNIIEQFAGEDVIWTVDLCQLRCTPHLVARLLDLGCLLFITGSKFYQAPPFCGAMLVPGEKLDALADVARPNVTGFDNLFYAQDFPERLKPLRAALARSDNLGLALRWEAALYEVSAFHELPAQRAARTIDQWNRRVLEGLQDADMFEPLRDQGRTNPSILSFRIKVGSRHLQHEELKKVYQLISQRTFPELLPEIDQVHIGQPVAYSSGSFLRLAIGAHDVRALACGDIDPGIDTRLIQAIRETVVESIRG